MTLLASVFLTLFGLAFGSFLNVCISRLPQHQSVVTPRSHCPRCGAFIPASDNIPLLSWILLRGRCRTCSAKISLRYPLVEAALPALWIACYFTFGWTLSFAGAAVFCFLLLGLAVMDAETMRLPDAFTLPGIVLGIAFAFAESGSALIGRALVAPQAGSLASSPASPWSAMGASAASAVLAAACIVFIRMLYRWIRGQEGMGLGDAKLLAMIAAWLRVERTILVFFVAVVAAALVGIAGRLLQPSQQSKEGWLEERLPFGTFLACAAIYALFLGWRTIHWYMGFF
ncbi:MAG TPA: prepilin peptidase [Acidisarcina sp.]|nr:prepilin peptidase [Acidisarcina sp.]